MLRYAAIVNEVKEMASEANTLQAATGWPADLAAPAKVGTPVPPGGQGAASRPVASSAERAPLPDWSRADAAGHVVQFYESEALLIEAVAEFLDGALQRGDAAIVVATEAHRAGIEERLRGKGADLDGACAARRYLWLNAAEARQRIVIKGRLQPERFSALIEQLLTRVTGPGRRPRVFGEIVALLAQEGQHDAARQVEELWGELQRRYSFSLLCGYPMAAVGSQALAKFFGEVCAQHAQVVPAESYTVLSSQDDRLRMIAELQQKAASLEAEIAEHRLAEAELVRKEAALRESEQRFRALAACSPVGIFLADTTGRCTYTNPRYRQICGLDEPEPPGHLWQTAIHPEDRPQVLRDWAALAAAGREYEGAFRVIRCDATVRWVHMRTAPLRSEAGTLLGYIGTVEDLTERRWTEALLAAERRALERIVQGAALGEVLDALCRTVEELSGEFLASILLLDEDGLHLRHGAAPSLPAAYTQAIDGLQIGPQAGSCGTAAHRRTTVVVEDIATDPLWGSFRALALAHELRACWSTPIMGSDGRVLGTFALYYHEPRAPSARDLHLIEGAARVAALAIERHRIERERARLLAREQAARAEADLERRRLRELFRQTPAAIALVRGPEHRFAFVNPLFERLMGRCAEALLGQPACSVFPELESQGYFDVLDQVCRSGEPATGEEYPARLDRRGDGVVEEACFNCVFQPLRGPRGEVEGILIHATEVTELVRARQHVEALAAEREAFLATVSHDLKNPLASLKGTTQLVRRWLRRPEGIDPERLAAAIDTIETTSNQMLGLIDELLDVTQLRFGQPLVLDRHPTDLVALARRLVERQQTATEHHRLRAECAVESLVGSWDAVRIERVLGNLLSNAVKYSPDGGEVRVEVVCEEGNDGRWAVVRVYDQGVGIPSDELDRVFQQFQRGSNVGRIAGTGLGLAAVRQIVEQHGGTVSVASEVGAGSTFTVRLPLDPSADGQ